MIETEVLVVGCGPAGLTAALALARSGTRVLAITKHPKLSPTPRAHITNQRSFEILRDFGLERQALALSTPYSMMPDVAVMKSLTGAEFARMQAWGRDPEGIANGLRASPCELADLPQHLLEPLLFGAAVGCGARVRFDTELVGFVQDEEGVTATVKDRLSGETTSVRARYMIGADGGRSVVAEALDLPMEGRMEIGGSLNLLFEADLAPYVAHRPALLMFMIRTAMDQGGVGIGILRCIKPWTRWMFIKGYAAGQASPELTEAEAVAAIRDYLGIPDLPIRIEGVDPWSMNASSATRYHKGRVFCVGDAVHRHLPSNGLGSNTGIQDSYNLAWKLDLVLKGKAGADLLETYTEERVPVGRQVVERTTRSLESYTPVLAALGVLDVDTRDQGERNLSELQAADAAGRERRRALRSAFAEKVYEYRARGVELNRLYASSAVLADGAVPTATPLDLELFYRPTTCPGAPLPHAMIQRDGHALSTLDLAGKGRFTLFTGVGGNAWIEAAQAAAGRLEIELPAFAIGPGCAYTDLYWAWAGVCEIEEDGCVLVRPDGHVAWRQMNGADAAKAPQDLLIDALCRCLSRSAPRPVPDLAASRHMAQALA